ncbi:MAG: diguanylate cyclase [Solirubrobacteraceae bacterium]|jgi:diguanylate cyclase (GGDEF)-like protein|nr:diguanylate cyclase [Solirubrobacteraceae bacterium]
MTWIDRLMPELARTGRRTRRVGTVAAAAMVATLVLQVGCTIAGLGTTGAYGVVLLLGFVSTITVLGLRTTTARGERRGWAVLTVAVGAWIAGAMWDSAAGTAADVGPADALWLAFYPLAYLAVGLRARATLNRLARSVRMDGLVGVLSVGAVGWVLVIDPIVGALPGRHVATIVSTAYVVGDLVLVGLTVAVLAFHGWHAGRGWALLGAGLAVFAAGDSLYLLEVARGTYVQGTPLDVLWGVGIVLMALSAWQPAPAARPAAPTLAVIAPPLAFALGALGVLVYAGLHRAPAAAVVLAAGATLASMGRTVLTFSDIRRFAEVRRQASTDDLTGLHNRRHLDRRLRERLDAAGERGASVALLVIDLDGFKELNDTLGHRAGDLVLEQIGPRLRAVLRASDDLARLGGDEFAVVLSDAADAEPVARRIGQALGAGLTIDGIDVRIGASIGIAVFPEHGDDAETLLQRADVAMYQAKTARSGHAFYERDRDRNSRERLALIAELRDAIGTDQLVLHFQPKLHMATGAVNDVEALVRWMHPERGLLGPGAFVPLAEQTGVMGELTEHVLDAALRQVAEWYERGLDLAVAVNVSAATLLDEGWAMDVAGALVRHGVPASRLRIEITEDALMGDAERALRVVEGLVATGIGVSVDDFGTGYSSLGLLKHLPVDELKIDRTFIRDLLTDDADAAIVQSVVDLGGRLGLRTVAEGVEDAETLDRIAAYGVTVAQGFHIARPLPAEELERWLVARARAVAV